MSNMNSNLQNYRIEVPTANISEERPDENVFKKAENVKNITAYGVGAQVIYVNNKRQKTEDRFAGLTKDFISDGGLKEKLNKYNSSVGVSSNGNLFRFTKKGSSLATNFPAESNYQQLTTYNVDLKVNDKARIASADNTNLEAIANRRIFSIMDKKSKELIRHENNYSKNPNKLEGLLDKPPEKADKSLKDQKSKSVSYISKEKPILKAKEREREKEKEEKKVLKNNFFEKPKSENTQDSNKLAVVYSKKGEYNSNKELNEQQRLRDSNYEQNSNNNYADENYEMYADENLMGSDNYNNDNLNIEQTKRQNFITSESNYNSNLGKANRPRTKPLPKDQYNLVQEMKLKKNNYLENQKKFAANLMEQNMKKAKEQQANKNARNESAETNQNYLVNNNVNNKHREKPLIPGRKLTNQNSQNSNNSTNNYNLNNNQNKSRITNPNEKSNKLEHINKVFTTEEKIENIEKINECFEKLEIKKVERESMDKIKKKVVLVQKKLRVLQEKGFDLNLDDTNNNNENTENEGDNAVKAQKANNNNEYDEEEKNYVFHDSDNNVEKENISSKNMNSNSEHDLNQIKNPNILKHKSNVNNENEDKLNFDNISKIKNSQINNYNNNNNLSSLQQQQKKPVVDTLEFVKKIQESRRKFASKSPGKSEILNRSDSFRRSNSESNQINKINNNNNKKNKFNLNDDEENNNENEIDYNDKENNLQLLTNKLLAAAKNNGGEADKRRKDLEIKQFIERKKKEKKMVELKIQEENRKNWENKVIQLLQLEKTISNKNEKVNYVKKSNNSSAQNYSRQSNSANKVRNDFYIGTKKPNLNTNLDESSILDPDDFYYTVLESKNIIVTQKSQSSNKINSVSAKNSNKSTANELNYNYNNAFFKTSDDFQKQNAVSRLSDFTQGNHYNYNLTNNNENYNNINNRKTTNLTNKLSQENFLKFLTDNEKITLRSLDSKNSGNNVIGSSNNNFNNYNNLNYNSNLKADVTQGLKSFTNNNTSNSPSNLKLTTDSKLIGSKSSNFNPAMRKSDNLFENNLENDAKKLQQQQNQNQSQLEYLSNKDKELSSSPAFDKSSDRSHSARKTQNKLTEKNQEDLSDLKQGNSLSERLIDRSDIEKDSFLLQFDNLLLTFANKLKHVYLRKHLSDLINNIIMQEQIKYCYETLSNLCNVGKRAVFNRLKEYANQVHVENIYSVFNNLTLFAKRNAMNKIFQYFAFVRNLESENNNTNTNLDNYKESDLDDYENLDPKKLEEIKIQYLIFFVGTIDRLFLIQKKDAMERIFEYARNFSLYNDLHLSGGSIVDKNDLSSNNLNPDLNPNTRQKQNLLTKSSAGGESHEESEYSEQDKIAKYYEYFKSTFDLMTRHIRKDAFYRIKNYARIKSQQQAKLNESNRSYNSNNNTNRDNNSSFNSERKREKIVLSKKSGENSFSSVFNQNKANSFIAQSHNSSNFSLHPNSLDSPKIRKLQFKIAQKNMEREWLENIDEKYGNNNNNNNNPNNSGDLNTFNQQHKRNASSANENKSNTSFSNTNINLQIKDNPLVRSDDENEESKNINFSKLSLDDQFKDSKRKFYEATNSNDNNNAQNKANNDLNNNFNNNEDNSIISNRSNNKNNSINVNKYSTVNYNEELNLNLGGEAERKKPINTEGSQIQHNNRYGSNDNEDSNYSRHNENSFNSAVSKKKNFPNLSPKLDRATDAIKRDDNEEAEKIKTQNQSNLNSAMNKSSQQAFDAAGNLKLDLNTSDKPKTDREFIQEEIVEDIQEDNLDVSTSNRKKHSLKDASGRFLGTDVDLSADRDNTSDIDWIYTVSHSKSGSLRDVTGGNIVKQFTDLTTNKNEEINFNNNNNNNNNNKPAAGGFNKEKEDASNLLRNSVSIGYESENTNNINNITKKSDKEISFNNNLNKSGKTEFESNLNVSNNLKKKEDLESKIKEMQIDPSAARKNTEEDYENNYDDFENIEEEIIVEEETDFAKILGEDSTSNVQGSLLKSRNSIKNGAIAHEEKEKEKQKENSEEGEKNKANAAEDIKKSFSQNAEEKEIDLTNKKVNLNVIPGKDTIESVKDIKSIESDDNDFFRIKNNNNQNILNLLDDKSSNNKSVSVNVLSHLSPDMGLMSDNTSSYNLKDIQLNRETINTDYLTALDKKSENTISTLNRKPEIVASKENLLLANNNVKEANNAANRRYESIENSAKKSEMLSSTEKEYLSTAEMDSLSGELAEKILNDLITSEIKDREKNLIPKKIVKSEAGLVNMLNSLNSTPLNRSLASLDNSMNSSINNTLFSKTVLEQKKENSMKLYIDQIGPKLIENIVEDITKNFSDVCQNLNMPYKSDSKEVIVAMSLRDRNRLKQSYKYLEKPENAKNFVKKKNILENFENTNKAIREDDNIISDNYYDNILNECLVDTANEVLEKERVYGEMGQPLAWSSRTRITKNKISNSEFSKNKIAQNLKKELSDMLNYRMGMITENYDYLEPEQINQEREKRSINHINKEQNDVEELWKNYEFEETQVKLELSELVLEQLLNEIVEIFEHIYNARKKPDLYQYKSIYACEEIPRLAFQQTNTDIDLDNINQ